MALFRPDNCELDGHKFEPRYDLLLPSVSKEGEELLIELLEVTVNYKSDTRQLFNQIYIHDICLRCGKVIARGDGETKSDDPEKPNHGLEAPCEECGQPRPMGGHCPKCRVIA
jgi:DNA-directed RNA polymerase subunit RPC12/RpoP